MIDREQQRRKRIEQLTSTCVHFNGTMNDECKAGIKYVELAGGDSPGWALRLPCHNVFAQRRATEELPAPAHCSLKACPSIEEAAEQQVREEERTKQFLEANFAAHVDAKEKGLQKGAGGKSNLPCPVCKTGTLYYSVASYNGHMHAKCSTPSCVSWME